GGYSHLFCNDVAHMAVCTIAAADLVSGSDDTGPHRGCGSLRNGLPLEWSLTFRLQLLIDLVHQVLNLARARIAGQLGLYCSRMHCRSAHPAIPMPSIEGNGEEDVRRLRSAISDHGIVGRPLKLGIRMADLLLEIARRRLVRS